MRDVDKDDIEHGRPGCSAEHAINNALECIYADGIHGLADYVSPNLRYEELIGTLLLARDASEELRKAKKIISEYESQ